MPLDKLLHTRVKGYTESMCKQLISDHENLHSLWGEALPHKPEFRDNLQMFHQMTVSKFMALGIDHDIKDSLDQSLPEELKKTMGRSDEVRESGSGPVAVLMEGIEKDPVGFLWNEDNQYFLQSTDDDALKAWNANTENVFCLDSDDDDRGLTIRVREPETLDDWLWAINASLSDTPFWLDTHREITKAWTPEAREASLETRRRRMADKEAIATTRRERSQPYPKAGLQKADEVTEYISKGSSVDYAKQVMASLPSKDLERSDIDTIIVHGPNAWDKFSSLAHLKDKEGGVLTLTPKSVTGEKRGPEAVTFELNLNGSASTKAQRLAILMAVGRQQLSDLDPIDARRVYDLFHKDRTGFSRRYTAAYAMYATGEGSRAKLAAKEPNIFSYFKYHFGSSEKSMSAHEYARSYFRT